MTSQSELLRPITQESGEGSARGEPRGQVMAADDEDDVERLDFEEQMQHLQSDEDEGDAEYEFPELKMGFDYRESERAGIPVGGEVNPQHRREPKVRVRGSARPASLTKTQRRQTWWAMPTTIQDALSA